MIQMTFTPNQLVRLVDTTEILMQEWYKRVFRQISEDVVKEMKKENYNRKLSREKSIFFLRFIYKPWSEKEFSDIYLKFWDFNIKPFNDKLYYYENLCYKVRECIKQNIDITLTDEELDVFIRPKHHFPLNVSYAVSIFYI